MSSFTKGSSKQKNMRIAYFLNDFPALSQTFILNQITGMIDAEANVKIYAFRNSQTETIQKDVHKYNLLENVKYIRPLPRGRLAGLFRIVSLVFSSISLANPASLFRAFRLEKDVPNQRALQVLNDVLQMETAAFDIVHCQFGTIGPRVLQMIEAGKLEGKLVVSFRGYDATKYVIPHPGIYNKLFKNADFFLPVSESLRQTLVEQGCPTDKIHILHSGLQTKKFSFQPKTYQSGKPIRLITIARLVEKKGISFAIKAVAKSIANGKNLYFDIIGEGPLRADLQNLINDLGLHDNITMLGPKTHNEVLGLLNESHILIAPSITAKDGDQEGIPNVMKEAMAIGLPVIGTNHGGIPELVQHQHSGFLVDEKNVEELSKTLDYLCNHPEVWASVCKEAREVIESDFDMERLNTNLLSIYQSLSSA